MPNLDKEAVDRTARERTECILKLIKEKYESSPTGKIQGYVLLSEARDVFSKKDLRKLRIYQKEEERIARLGSNLCADFTPERHAMVEILLSYIIYCDLMRELKEYPFTKLDISFDDMQEYHYDENRFFKYKKTGYEIPLFKLNIEW